MKGLVNSDCGQVEPSRNRARHFYEYRTIRPGDLWKIEFKANFRVADYSARERPTRTHTSIQTSSSPFSSCWWEFKTIRWVLSVGTYSWRRIASGSMLDARLAGT